jgi:hypothetical protein
VNAAGEGGLGPLLYANRIQRDIPVAATADLVRFHVDWDRVLLTWYWPDLDRSFATVERRDPNSDWLSLGQAVEKIPRHLEFEDRSVVAGATYAYRLRIANGPSPLLTQEVWIDVPRATAMSLSEPRPNPVRHQFAVDPYFHQKNRSSWNCSIFAGAQ